VTDNLAFPTTDSGWHEWTDEYTAGLLNRAREIVAELKDGTARDTATVLALWNDLDLALGDAGAICGLLSEVHPDDATRTLAEERMQEVSRLGTDIGLDRGLFDVLDATEPDGLDLDRARLRERVLRDFRRSGVDRDDETRARLREISERIVVLDQDFSRNIRTDVRSIRITPDRLDGLPADFVEAHPPAEDGLVTITTEYPDIVPFRTFAKDAAARHELVQQFENRAFPQNEALLAEVLALRAEYARLLGYDSWPDYDAEVKMIGSGAAIEQFLDRIVGLSDLSSRRDYDVLLERLRQDEPGAEQVLRADSMYYGELVRREQFDVDAQEVRRYFDFSRVRAGLLEVTGKLFGIEYFEVPDAPVWHEDVTGYDVMRDGERVGRIYLDLHPRPNKYGHAAQFELRTGLVDRELAEGVLVCNFGRGLIQHSDVVTFFHEFGHLVHEIVGGAQTVARFSGVATEWDFVEAPSQMLEEWAWDADVLQTFAKDENGVPIPRELVSAMRAARDFGKGYGVRTQMYYAALSYRLHRDPPADITALQRELQRTIEPFAPVEDSHFFASFGHLMGYTSGYYTYMWSLVIAKDMFSAFDDSNLLAPEVAHRYRDRILARGGAADAAELVADFLGRPYAFDAYAAWLDEAPARLG